MANAILGGDTSARKPSSLDITTLPESWYALDGLIDDPLIDLDTQIAVLGLIDETGSAPLGDLIEMLPGHAAPGKAIEAFLRHGVVSIEPGLIDAQSLVSRRVNPPVRGAASETPQGGKAKAAKVHHLGATTPEPDIFFAAGIDRNFFVTEPRLRQNGIYFAVYGRKVYTGRAGDTASRVAWGAHLRAHGIPDLVIAAVDRHGALSEDQTRACERLATRWVDKHPGLTRLNKTMPAGARLAPGPFSACVRFVDRLVERVQAAGLFESEAVQSLEPVLAQQDAPVPNGEFLLEACGVSARLVWRMANGVSSPAARCGPIRYPRPAVRRSACARSCCLTAP